MSRRNRRSRTPTRSARRSPGSGSCSRSRPTGALRVVREPGDLEFTGPIRGVMHIEGAEAIDPGLEILPALHALGLRSLGITWSRPNAFGHGVPFAQPSSPDTGPGLTDAGRALVRACNALGILVDLAHLNERGFWDVGGRQRATRRHARLAPARSCLSARNLTDAAARRGARLRGRRRRLLPPRGRRPAARRTSRARSTTSRAASAPSTSRSARTSTAASCRPGIAGAQDLPLRARRPARARLGGPRATAHCARELRARTPPACP